MRGCIIHNTTSTRTPVSPASTALAPHMWKHIPYPKNVINSASGSSSHTVSSSSCCHGTTKASLPGFFSTSKTLPSCSLFHLQRQQQLRRFSSGLVCSSRGACPILGANPIPSQSPAPNYRKFHTITSTDLHQPPLSQLHLIPHRCHHHYLQQQSYSTTHNYSTTTPSSRTAMPLLGAIDSGTTSTRFMLFDSKNLTKPLYKSQLKHETYYPKPGYVEHDVELTYQNTLKCLEQVATEMNPHDTSRPCEKVAAIGITNQRETTVLWHADTGKVLGRSLVWNDARTKDLVEELRNSSPSLWDTVKQKSGLSLATYFSGIKLRWLLENDEPTKAALKEKKIMFGTIDTWLIWKLTGGVNGGVHVTDVTNASRTMLMNLETLQWDKTLFDALNIPFQDGIQFPEIRSCAEVYGTVSEGPLKGTPIAGCAGDQQAALIGQRCFSSGDTKCTYGTGCFMLMNTGTEVVHSTHGLLTTVAYQFGKEKPHYALEGSVANAGASVEWMKNNLQLISSVGEIEGLVDSVEDSGDVYFVPAFSGLFAPYWRPDARGTIVGMTLYTKKAHVVRALLESICFQNQAVLESMLKDSNIQVPLMKVDGGMTQNNALMQIQSNILNMEVHRPEFMELTVVGATICAGIGSGVWQNESQVPSNGKFDSFQGQLATEKRKEMLMKWNRAVEKSFGWERRREDEERDEKVAGHDRM